MLGEDRPKQFAKLLGPRSLLRQTLDRVALGISPDRTVVVTVRRHTDYVAEEFTGAARPPYLLAQPEDRGTAAAILYAAQWIAWRDPAATISSCRGRASRGPSWSRIRSTSASRRCPG